MEASLILAEATQTQTSQPRLRLFSKTMETWILILPFLALPLFLAEHFFKIQWSALDWNISSFLVSSLGLSVVHNYFTVALLFGLPEFQNWRKDHLDAHPWLFRFRIYGVSFFILFLTMIAYDFWGVAEVWSAFIGIGFTVISAHHSFSQSLGLSQAYTMQMAQDANFNFMQRRQFKIYQDIEVRLKKILVPAQFIWGITLFVPLFLSKYFPQANVLSSLQTPARLILIALMLAFLINCFLIVRLRPSNKLWFSFRILLYASAIGSTSLALVFILRLIHGVEYWGVFQTLTQHSSATQKNKRKLYQWTAVITLIAVLMLIFRRGDGFYSYFADSNGTETHWLIPLIAAFSLAMTHIHFFLDGLLFRMRDPISRKWIAPLLSPKPTKIMVNKSY